MTQHHNTDKTRKVNSILIDETINHMKKLFKELPDQYKKIHA